MPARTRGHCWKSSPPVTEGALFFLGDGHALQGDGEITGTGLEISMDVEFSVSLHPQASIQWPRGETADHLFTVGNVYDPAYTMVCKIGKKLLPTA